MLYEEAFEKALEAHKMTAIEFVVASHWKETDYEFFSTTSWDMMATKYMKENPRTLIKRGGEVVDLLKAPKGTLEAYIAQRKKEADAIWEKVMALDQERQRNKND